MATQIRSTLYGNKAGLSDGNALILAGRMFSVTAVQTAGAANITNVMLQVVDNQDRAIAGVFVLEIFLSDSAVGAGLTATTASGTVVVGTPGADLFDFVAKKFKAVQTDATGKYQLVITDTAKTNFKVCVRGSGPTVSNVIVVATLTTGLYG